MNSVQTVLLAVAEDGATVSEIPVFRVAAIGGIIGIILTCVGLWLAFHTFKNARNDQPKKNVDMLKNVLLGATVAVLCMGTGLITMLGALLAYFTTFSPDTSFIGS